MDCTCTKSHHLHLGLLYRCIHLSNLYLGSLPEIVQVMRVMGGVMRVMGGVMRVMSGVMRVMGGVMRVMVG